jgi:uncharacterized SAM-binding protein YcdF (DUF218 family)
MFLFLSKLLPLFVYPLGLTCLLLIAALILVWRYPRATASVTLTALMLLIFAGNGWVAATAIRSLEGQYLPTELPQAEAIVVLGGATRSPESPRPWVEVSEAGDRVLYAAKLYREGKAPIVVLSGGRIRWRGGEGSEAADMAELMEPMGVPRSAILEEPDSFNTYENARNVKVILDREGIDRVLLVTSAFHMPRSMAIFRKQGIEAIAAPTDFLVADNFFEASRSTGAGAILSVIPDAENLMMTTKALKEYIGAIIYRARGWL